ncbi:hypothetical protein COL5a_005054 [Colletotrichum fioriniae]|uniref:uncharacterized protein n=1 Tax=Colletotrichum fioriniae TaxID=710243 RepID=UPI002301DFAF|nr:uncharacterized protein COL516b_011837 [Colletotrichum fioriniae]KAJ0296189.1 hypothetical protein COL516b_011837 [Colletotrichum fioriniae]KAJ0328278.1 hypothetical protein COL5a_005054 [Colletotrichum fioriniae]KAJ3938925.1 hypothetical protein N0V96_011032 [Colletotrichum fioriniae]
MPRQERHHKERVVYDDDPYYDDYERPRASRRVSRSAHEYEAGGGHRRSTRRHDSYSPVGPVRARSESYGRPPARRHDTYAEYSDSGDERPRRRGHGQSSSRRKDSKTSRSSRGPERNDSDKAAIIQAAATAAVVAGASEAWRMRKEKTSWSQKGTRMATAAAGAAAIAAFNNNTNGQHGSKDGGGSKKDTIQATLGGLLVNRLANGVGKK